MDATREGGQEIGQGGRGMQASVEGVLPDAWGL